MFYKKIKKKSQRNAQFFFLYKTEDNKIYYLSKKSIKFCKMESGIVYILFYFNNLFLNMQIKYTSFIDFYKYCMRLHVLLPSHYSTKRI